MVIVGIDLGTTNSAVAVFEDGLPQVIQDETGKRLIPSMVTFTEEKVLVGAMAHSYPEDTIYDAKRFIGQKFHYKNVQKDIGKSDYKVVNQEGRPYVKVTYKCEELIISIEEVIGHLLKHIKTVAENHLNQEVTGAVIGVPAHFDDVRRNATKKAAEIAGFKMIRIINEPTAAAITSQYRNKDSHPKKVLVYDFGGGTFDISIVSVNGRKVDVITSDGDCYLGGKDIDANIIEYILKVHGVNLKNINKLRRLRNICESTKKALSFSENHLMEISDIMGVNDYRLTRGQFENINKHIFQKTIKFIDRVLSGATLTVDDINEVILVGGSSRIPKVRNLLETKFPNSIIKKSLNPDEAIALGAAIYGGQINGDKVLLKVQDILTRSLGIQVWGDLMDPIISRNTKLPCLEQISSHTIKNYQTSIVFKVYQGESLIASRNNLLREFTIRDLRKDRRGAVKILVTMSFNEEGILKVIATEAGTDNSKVLTISITNEINPTSQPLEIDQKVHEEELKYVKFIEKRNAFLGYCEDVKFDYEEELELQPDILRKIERKMEVGEGLKQGKESVLKNLKREVESLVMKHLED